MATNVAIAQGTLPDAASTVDLTISGESRTPTGAIVFATRAPVLNTDTDHAYISIGYTDFTDTLCLVGNAEHNQTPTDTACEMRSDVILAFNDEGSNNPDKTATAAAISGGIRLTADAGDSALSYEVAAFIVFGAECKAFNAGDGTAASGTFAVTHGLTGKPNFGIGTTCRNAVGAASTQWGYSFGFFSDDGTILQGCAVHHVQDAQTDGEAHASVRNNRIAFELANNGTEVSNIELTSNDGTSSTFTVETGESEGLIGLLVYAADVQATAVSIDTPTSAAADWNYNGLSFTSQCLIAAVSDLTAENTLNQDVAVAGVGGIWAFDDAGTEVSATWADENAANPTSTQSRVDTKLYMPTHDGTAEFNMTNPAFTADGFDIAAADITTADGTVRKFVGLAIEAGDPGIVITVPTGPWR